MKGISKFEHDAFWDDWNGKWLFAVSKQKYTIEEARRLFAIETDNKAEFCQTQDAAVCWRAGINENGDPCVGWWLEMDKDGTEPRCCPVWVFEY